MLSVHVPNTLYNYQHSFCICSSLLDTVPNGMNEKLKNLEKIRGTHRRKKRSTKWSEKNNNATKPEQKKRYKNKFIIQLLRTLPNKTEEHLELDIYCKHRQLYSNDSFVRTIVTILNKNDIKVINNGRLFERNKITVLNKTTVQDITENGTISNNNVVNTTKTDNETKQEPVHTVTLKNNETKKIENEIKTDIENKKSKNEEVKTSSSENEIDENNRRKALNKIIEKQIKMLESKVKNKSDHKRNSHHHIKHNLSKEFEKERVIHKGKHNRKNKHTGHRHKHTRRIIRNYTNDNQVKLSKEKEIPAKTQNYEKSGSEKVAETKKQKHSVIISSSENEKEKKSKQTNNEEPDSDYDYAMSAENYKDDGYKSPIHTLSSELDSGESLIESEKEVDKYSYTVNDNNFTTEDTEMILKTLKRNLAGEERLSKANAANMESLSSELSDEMTTTQYKQEETQDNKRADTQQSALEDILPHTRKHRRRKYLKANQTSNTTAAKSSDEEASSEHPQSGEENGPSEVEEVAAEIQNDFDDSSLEPMPKQRTEKDKSDTDPSTEEDDIGIE